MSAGMRTSSSRDSRIPRSAIPWPGCARTDPTAFPSSCSPSSAQQLAAGRPFTRSAAVVASWARYAEGTDENGAPHEINDYLAPQLHAAARRQRRHRTAFLEDNRAVFGELADDPRFTAVYSSILTALLDHGVRKTLSDLDHYATPSAAGREPACPERNSP